MENEIMTWEMFEEACKNIANSKVINLHHVKNIYGIPRGGLVLAVRLSHLMKLPLITDFTNAYFNLETIVADDISDTGKTLEMFKNNITATLYYKPCSIITPNVYWKKTKKYVVFPWESK